MENLCDIFRKLALIGKQEEFTKAIFSLKKNGGEEEMRKHIEDCHICLETKKKMGIGDKAFVSALLSINIE